MSAAYLARIADLEEQVEAWRQRAEAAEGVLQGDRWDQPVRPLSLYETRVMRLLAKRDMSGSQLVDALLPDYPATNDNSLTTMICRIRARLPESLAPPCNVPVGWGVSATYTVLDRPALIRFLASGLLPATERRAA